MLNTMVLVYCFTTTFPEQQNLQYSLIFSNYSVVIGSIIILLVAVCWFMVIICLRVAGRNRVGFLAGRFQKPSFASLVEYDGVEVVIGNEGEEYRDSSVEKTKEEKKYYRKVWVARIVFIISGLFVIVAGGLFYGKGVVAFKR